MAHSAYAGLELQCGLEGVSLVILERPARTAEIDARALDAWNSCCLPCQSVKSPNRYSCANIGSPMWSLLTSSVPKSAAFGRLATATQPEHKKRRYPGCIDTATRSFCRGLQQDGLHDRGDASTAYRPTLVHVQRKGTPSSWLAHGQSASETAWVQEKLAGTKST